MSRGALPAWWTDRAQRKRRNALSRKQERDRARATGGRPQPGSGSSWRAAGDVRSPSALEECKWTDAASYTLKVEEIEDIIQKAALVGREPQILIEFRNHDLKVLITPTS